MCVLWHWSLRVPKVQATNIKRHNAHRFNGKTPIYNARAKIRAMLQAFALTRKVTPNLELKLTKQPSSNSA